MEIWDLKYQFEIKQTFYKKREREESEKIQNPKAEIKKKLEICWDVVRRNLRDKSKWNSERKFINKEH